MKLATCVAAGLWLLLPTVSEAQTLVDADFAQGGFAELGWQATGGWDVYTYPKEVKNNPGALARLPANKPEGRLSKSFDEVRNPRKLELSLDYGWGWGDANQGADMVACMLLNSQDDGYLFEVHRVKAHWAVQWGRVEKGQTVGSPTWAPVEIDATHAAVRDGGGLSRLIVIRTHDGAWALRSPAWNQGQGGEVRFSDVQTTSFNKIVLVGTKNFDDQLYGKVVLKRIAAAEAREAVAVPTLDFLNSVGIVTTFPDRGQPIDKTIELVKYVGFRWVRGGIEGVTKDGPTTIQTYLDLHKGTGAKVSWGLVSGGADLDKLIDTARPLAAAGALLAFEGNNEPNNWGVKYQGEEGGGRAPSWMAVAKLQRDLYRRVKSDPDLKQYPVWSISEAGAETDNVGLQYLTIPEGAGALLPDKTQFADAVNVHNYIYHPGSPGLADNKAWNAADPSSACRVDGLFGNHGVTWGKKFRGYTETELQTLPRVTTETGTTIGGDITEEIHGLNLLTIYLAQFKRGWSHTSVYLLRDRTDEGGNQAFGFYNRDYTPRKAAVYLHNLTTILNDRAKLTEPGRLSYAIPEQPATVHDLLLQNSRGDFQLVIWGERLTGTDEVTVQLGGVHKGIAVFNPTVGVEPVQTLDSAAELKLKVSNHPWVVVIPGGGR